MSTYRFSFSEHINTLLYDFASEHIYDTRLKFKDEWNLFIIEHKKDIDNETARLHNIGYQGEPVVIKMFKSAKYYFVKKVKNELNINNNDHKTKQYIKVSPLFLEQINAHICQTNLSKPSQALDDFMKQHYELICHEVILLRKLGLSNEQICDKIKKTYKNKHYAVYH